MRMEMTFDDAAIKRNHFTRETVYSTVKQRFEAQGLPCVSDGDVLAFTTTGHKDDYSNILLLILAISRSDWFLEVASSCIFYDDEGHKENILAEARQQKTTQAIKKEG